MIAAGLGFAAVGFIFFYMASTGASATAPTHGVVAALIAALGAAAGVIFLLFGALHVVLAVGIFRLRNVARVYDFSIPADRRRSLPGIAGDAA